MTKKTRKRGIAPTPSPARDLEQWRGCFYAAVSLILAMLVGFGAWVYLSG